LCDQLDQFETPPQQWLGILAAERQHLARLADRMVGHETTLAEIEAEVRSRIMDQLEDAIRGIVTDLGGDPNGEATRQIVAHHFRRVAAGDSPLRPIPPPSAPPDPAPVPPFQVTPPPAAEW
jgi:hypothetical protein